jgi:hypothetical protein
LNFGRFRPNSAEFQTIYGSAWIVFSRLLSRGVAGSGPNGRGGAQYAPLNSDSQMVNRY